MKKIEIDGVIFEDQGVALTSEDGSLVIWNPDDAEQSFMFERSDLSSFSSIFKRFNCAALSFRRLSDDAGSVDLDLVLDDEKIRKLSVGDFRYPIRFCFQEGKVYFPMVRQLLIFGKYPDKFPDLSGNRNLVEISLEYERSSLNCWSGLDQVRDLRISRFSEVDLTRLAGLRNLERLKIEDGAMKNLDGLEQFKNLKTLIIAKAPKLSNLDAMGKAPNLQNIQFIQYPKISDWDFLSDISNLRHLDLDVVDSVDFRLKLPRLSYLHARKVKSRSNKRFLFETEGRFEEGAAAGIDVKYIPSHDVFLQPLHV